jgi:hypothetical protein
MSLDSRKVFGRHVVVIKGGVFKQLLVRLVKIYTEVSALECVLAHGCPRDDSRCSGLGLLEA